MRRDPLDELRGKGPDAEVKRTDATSLYGVPLLRGGIFMAAKMRRSVLQSIPTGVDTLVVFDTKMYDNWDKETQGNEKMLDLANEKIEIRRAGIYGVSARVVWDGDDLSADLLQLTVKVNGGVMGRAQAWIGTGNASLSFPTCAVNEPLVLVRGDDISMSVLHNRSGAPMNIIVEGETPYLAATWQALP